MRQRYGIEYFNNQPRPCQYVCGFKYNDSKFLEQILTLMKKGI